MRAGFWLGLWCCALLWAPAAWAQERAYAVIVAHNGAADPGVAPLRYADDDGARYWELFSAMADEVTLLTTLDEETQRLYPALPPQTAPPTRAGLRATLARARARIEEDQRAGLRATLYLVFVGHGAVDADGMGYLSLGDGRYTREALLEDLLEAQPADQVHLIIDACHAWFMLNARGDGVEEAERSGRTWDDAFAAWLRQERVLERHPRLGVMLSTSGAAEVHEWSRYRGGVFSHELRSGLLGAADVDGDLRVTYPEIEAWLAAANASVQHPRAKIQFHVSAPRQDRAAALIALPRLKAGSLLELPAQAPGRYHVEDSRGLRYADFHSAGDGPLRLALLPQATHYFIRRGDDEARVEHPGGADRLIELSLASFAPTDAAALEARSGAIEESYRRNLFGTPYGLGFFQGFQAAQARAQAPSPPPAPEAPLELRLGLGLSQAPLADLAGPGGPQLITEAALAWWGLGPLALELAAQYGTSGHDALRQHRPALGLGLRAARALPWELSLTAAARGFAQWLLFDGERRLGDKLSWRGDLWLGLERPLWRDLRVELRLGYALDVVSVAQTSDGADLEPRLEAAPQAGLTLGWTF
jgi:hypothetical protein